MSQFVRGAYWLALACLAVGGAPPTQAGGQEACPAAGNEAARLGWEAYRAGRMEEARAAFLRSLGRCPWHLGARTALGYVDMRQGLDEEARARFEVVAEVDPENLDAFVGLGILAWRRGDLQAVGRRFGQVLALDPDNATALDYLARLPEAATVPELPEEPRPPTEPVEREGLDTLLARADRAWNLGEHETAAGLYGEILGADPRNGTALHRLALVAGWGSRYDEALTLFDRLLELEPANLEARVHRARTLAWRGDLAHAMESLDTILAWEPTNAEALSARAQFQSWSGEYSEALSAYEALADISHDPTGVLLAQARTLGWASRLKESKAVYDSILAVNPGNLEARLGLARILVFSDRTDEAIQRYEAILDEYPGHPEAVGGRARALTFGGRLPDGEGAWRAFLDESPGDLVARAGLAQNLRWQGRNEAALAVLEAVDPTMAGNPAFQEQLDWVRSTLDPRSGLTLVRESDSDENVMTTVSMTGRWNPRPGWEVGGEAYTRDLEQSTFDLSRTSWGMTLDATYRMEPGWAFNAGLGGTRTDGEGDHAFASWRIQATTPGRYPYGGAILLSGYALDATAQLVERGVTVQIMDLSGRWAPVPRWQIAGSVGMAAYQGEKYNRRLHVTARAERRLTRGIVVGLSHRAYGFRKDLDEFYFDPDYLGLTEVTGRWVTSLGKVDVILQLAPGAQKVSAEGLQMALRTSARVLYRFKPGREISLTGGYSSAGLQSFTTGESDYRYTALTLGARWVF